MQTWYFYSTYLASRLAGAAHKPAQELAYLCQTLDEMLPASDLTKGWTWREHDFTPCLSGLGNAKAKMISDQARRNCELLFRRLPDVDATSNAITQQSSLVNLLNDTFEKVQTWFNPLTDIDWIRQGRFRSTLQKRLTSQVQQHMRSETNDIEADISPAPCRQNSQTATALLEDGFALSRKNKHAPVLARALLACCLYTFQNTWLQAKQEKGDDDFVLHKDAFLAMTYTLRRYFSDTSTMTSNVFTKHKDAMKSGPFPRCLTHLISEHFDDTYTEINNLHVLRQVLEHYQCAPLTVEDVMINGLRYRKGYLLHSLRQSGAVDHNREIIDLPSFKNSGYFRLNQAMTWQSRWLSIRFKNAGIDNIPIVQNIGNEKIWQ